MATEAIAATKERAVRDSFSKACCPTFQVADLLPCGKKMHY
jgi:hypothetical protein